MLRFEESGQGSPLIMLHAFPLTGQMYWQQLEKPPDGVRFIAPDFRGFGKSASSAGSMTMESMADDVLALMDRLELPSAFIGGVSMGGYVAMALTRRDPGRVRGLVLADTQLGADDEAGRAKRETTAKELESKGIEPLIASMLPKFLTSAAPTALRERLEQIMRSVSAQAAAAATRAMALRVDARDILSRFGGPSLVLVGDGDAVTPLEKAKAMADLLGGAKLEVIVGAAHLSNVEQPEAFNTALARFFAAAERR